MNEINQDVLLNNNKVYLQGEVVGEVQFSHSVMDENIYTFRLAVPRLSGEIDTLPIMISSKLMTNLDLTEGSRIALRGQFRSYNKQVAGRSKLVLSVFCREICEWNNENKSNVVELTGYICKPVVYRVTPLNREISDVLVAVNRKYNKSDYIPCIAWGRNARFVNQLPVGTKIEIVGRIQSRGYEKHEEGIEIPIQHIAYEVSVSQLATLDANNDAII